MRNKIQLKSIFKPRRFSTKYRGSTCLNCKHDLDVSDRFCPYCGQPNSTKKINLGDLLQELLSSVFSYDSKLWRSLKLLFAKPGSLSLLYINGKRNTYINPFRFFLSISVLFFLIISLSISDDDFEGYDFIKVESVDFKNEESNQVAKDTLADASHNLAGEKQEIQKKEPYLKKSIYNESYPTFEKAIAESELEDNYLDWAMYKIYKNIFKLKLGSAGFIRYMLPKIPFFIFFLHSPFYLGKCTFIFQY